MLLCVLKVGICCLTFFLDGGGIEGVIDLILDRPPFCRVPGVRDVLWSG